MSAAAPGWEERSVAANGLRFRVLQAGPAGAPLVLLLHGFPEGALCWRQQIGALAAAGFRVWAPDQRGYGGSDKPQGIRNYRLPLLAADAFGLLDAAGVVGARVVAHDWGGAVAWWMAQARPDRVERLAILNCPHPAVMRRALLTDPLQMLRSWYIAFFQLPWLPEALLGASGGALLAKGLRDSSRKGAFAPAQLEAYRRDWGRPGALRAMIDWYRALRFPLRMGGRVGAASTPRVLPPTLILWGRRDRAIRAALARASLERCADGRLVMLEDATHWLQHEEAGRVNAALLEFLPG
ncbi:MAG TPA: alpha/beta hydrolase [Planctomycetota bacterium]|nr:alpha/beta hydrolase [Planctomycetota bacterium]